MPRLPLFPTCTDGSCSLEWSGHNASSAARHGGRTLRRIRRKPPAMPVMYSVEEGTSGYSTAAHVARITAMRTKIVAQRRKRVPAVYHSAIEGDVTFFLSDKGPLRCHCSGAVACGYPMVRGKEGNNWCQRTIRRGKVGCSSHQPIREVALEASEIFLHELNGQKSHAL